MYHLPQERCRFCGAASDWRLVMALDTQTGSATSTTRRRKTCTSWARCRRSAMCRSRCTPGRSGASGTARRNRRCSMEVVDTWTIDSHEVLVLVMAAGVNYNGVWAGLGQPISPFDGHKAALSHRRVRCLGHRLGGGRQGEALEGRRRGGDPLQPGRRRRRGMQRRRPDVLPHASGSGAMRRRTGLSRSSPGCRRSS